MNGGKMKKKIKFNIPLEHVAGHLRYGHMEGTLDLTEEEFKELEEDPLEFIDSNDILDDLELIIDDYRIEDWGEPTEVNYKVVEQYYINYEHLYNSRPEEKDICFEKDCLDRTYLKIRCQFPKTIKKGTYIISEFGPASYDAILEFKALRALKKPLQICATSGHWEGTPFLLYASDDIIITKQDEKFIQDYIKDYR